MTKLLLVDWFNGHIAAAKSELVERAQYRSPHTHRFCVESAVAHLREALRLANRIGCSARKALCLRILNWLQVELRRLPA